MLSFQSFKSIASASILFAVCLLLTGVANAQNATDFAIFSTDDVSLETYSVVRGDVYSGRNIEVQFGYGIQVRDLNMGNMFAYGDYTQESLSDLNGSVFANGDVTLNGSAEVIEDVIYGGVFSTTSNSARVNGDTQQQSNSVGVVSLPAASEFSAGTNDVTSSEDLTLAPGAYRNLEMTGLFDTLTLTSGNYYLRQLNFQTGTTVSLQIIDGEPINVFLEGDANFGTGMKFEVNGIEIGTAAADSVAELASLVMFEAHGDVTIESGFTSDFFGTIFAPFGNVNVDLGDMHGSIISGRPVAAEVYLDHQPSNYLSAQTAPLLGDCNLDGVVSFFDIPSFIDILTAGGYLKEADCNQDDVMNFLDIPAFIVTLAGN